MSASLGKEETAPPEALPYKRRLSYRTAAEEARVEAAKPTRMRCSGAHSSGILIGMWWSALLGVGQATGLVLTIVGAARLAPAQDLQAADCHKPVVDRSKPEGASASLSSRRSLAAGPPTPKGAVRLPAATPYRRPGWKNAQRMPRYPSKLCQEAVS